MAHEVEAYDVVGPILTRTACIAVTSTSAAVDLSADAQIGPSFAGGQFIRLYADGADVYYGFSFDNTTVTAIDDTATGVTAGKCQCLAAGTWIDVCMPWLAGQPCKYLYTKTKTGLTATLRISPSSIDARNRYQG